MLSPHLAFHICGLRARMSQIYCHREMATAEITTIVCKTDNRITFPSSFLSSNQQINLNYSPCDKFNLLC